MAVGVPRLALRKQQIRRVADFVLETDVCVRFPKMVGGRRLRGLGNIDAGCREQPCARDKGHEELSAEDVTSDRGDSLYGG